MSVFELWLLIDINMYLLLPDDQQIANEGWFCLSKSKNEFYGILWTHKNIVTENTKKS